MKNSRSVSFPFSSAYSRNFSLGSRRVTVQNLFKVSKFAIVEVYVRARTSSIIWLAGPYPVYMSSQAGVNRASSF